MHFITGFLRTIILLGAVQGFVLSTLLFFSTRKKTADGIAVQNSLPNRLLAVLLFLIALASIKEYGAMEGWFVANVYMRVIDALVPMIIVMPLGPLLFFYIRSHLDPGFRLHKKDRRHFYPVIIDLVPQITTLIFIAGILTHLLKNVPGPWGQFIDTYNVYSDIPRWISLSIYLWMAWKYLAAQKSPSPKLHWLRQFVRVFLTFQCIWLIYLVPYVIPQFTDRILNSVDWYPVFVPLAILIYWLGIKGYIMSFREHPVKEEPGRSAPLSPEIVHQYIAALESAMQQDRLYLNAELTVTALAAHTGLSSKIISAVLNNHIHKSFSLFVNEYRVREITERLSKPESREFTIAGLAYECGFNSQPTFQRAFKTIMGCSPTAFQSKTPFKSGIE